MVVSFVLLLRLKTFASDFSIAAENTDHKWKNGSVGRSVSISNYLHAQLREIRLLCLCYIASRGVDSQGRTVAVQAPHIYVRVPKCFENDAISAQCGESFHSTGVCV